MKLQTNYPLLQRVRASEKFLTPKNLILKLLIFAGIFFLSSLAETAGMVALIFPRIMDWAMRASQANNGVIDPFEANDKIYAMLEEPVNTTIMLYCTALATIIVLLFCRIVEGRKLRTIGFKAKGGLVQYLIGLAAGFVMFSVVVGIAWAMGGLRFEGMPGFTLLPLLIVLVGYGLQGMSEEVLCRGYLMTTVMHDQPVWAAVAVNSIIFGLLHGANNGFSWLAFVNLVLTAVMFSLYVLRTDNLWGACAVHSIWNFVQGNFYGLPVSGIDSGDSVFRMSLQGSTLANGGAFGLEASLATTIVMTVVILLLLFVPGPRKKAETAPAEETA